MDSPFLLIKSPFLADPQSLSLPETEHFGWWPGCSRPIHGISHSKKILFCIISFFFLSFSYSYLMALHFLSAVGVGYSFFQACKLFSKGTHLYYITYHQYSLWVCTHEKPVWHIKTAAVHSWILPSNNFIYFFHINHPLFSFDIEFSLKNDYVKNKVCF